jgi:hypothetical protein
MAVADSNLRLYGVALIDLLGQGDKLNQLRNPGALSEDALKAALDSSLGKVRKLRDHILHLVYLQPATSALGRTLFKEFPDDLRRWAESVMDSRFTFQYFGDTVLVYWPLRSNNRPAMAFSLWHMLHVMKVVVLTQFADGCAVRGGVEIGYAVEWEERQLYGPVVADAYRLESKIADYPRVLVGSNLRTFLGESVNQEQETVGGSVQQRWGHSASRFLCRDTDGCWMLDFLGIHESTGCMEDFPNVLPAAMGFIKTEAARWRTDKKLGPRYERLIEYCTCRERQWTEFFNRNPGVPRPPEL